MANRKKAAEEKAALEAAEKVEFLRNQAEIEKVVNEQEELERAEAEKTEAFMLTEIEAKRLQAAKLEEQRLTAEHADQDRCEPASTASESRTSNDSRLDAVEQRMDKFSEKQEDMKKQIDSFGDTLKMILERLPEKRS